MLMDLAPSLSFSRESSDNISGMTFNSLQLTKTTRDASWPTSSPARRQAHDHTPARRQLHDQGSIEVSKEAAARFGLKARIRNTSSGSLVVKTPSNMSESNFRTPIQESIPSSRHWWNMRGGGTIIPTIVAVVPCLVVLVVTIEERERSP